MNTYATRQITRLLALTLAIPMTAAPSAGHGADDHVTVTRVSRRDIVERLDGRESRATVETVTIAPGQADSAHRHSGPAFGYVLEGEYEHAIDDEPARIYKAGETFYEPSGALHRVARNPNPHVPARILALFLHPRDTSEVTAPAERRP